jgi:UDP-glucose 4-epimerase
LVSLRLFNAYGPRQNLEELKQGMVSIYLAQFLHHEKVIVKGAFERVRDFIYIDDIVNAIATVLNSPGPSKGIYNLCFGKTTSVGELIELIRKISGIDKEIICQGNTLGDVSGFSGNNNLFCTTFNWQPKVTIGEGLKKMISYYMQEG